MKHFDGFAGAVLQWVPASFPVAPSIHPDESKTDPGEPKEDQLVLVIYASGQGNETYLWTAQGSHFRAPGFEKSIPAADREDPETLQFHRP